jgi:hypothetical protein
MQKEKLRKASVFFANENRSGDPPLGVRSIGLEKRFARGEFSGRIGLPFPQAFAPMSGGPLPSKARAEGAAR